MENGSETNKNHITLQVLVLALRLTQNNNTQIVPFNCYTQSILQMLLLHFRCMQCVRLPIHHLYELDLISAGLEPRASQSQGTYK